MPQVVDIFCGAGGFSLGATLAGARICLGIDLDGASGATFEGNFGPGTFAQLDLEPAASVATAARAIRERVGGTPDLVVGGPPCQGFSRARHPRERETDPRNRLVSRFAEVVGEVQPPAFVMENVPGLVTSAIGRARVESLMAVLGGTYRIVEWRINASQFGVPQVRWRAFLAGYRTGTVIRATGLDAPTLRRPFVAVTVGDAISDLPQETVAPDEISTYLEKPRNRYERLARWRSTILYNHNTKRLQELRQERIRSLQPGQDQRSLPDHLRTDARAHKYRRLDPGRASPTVTAHMAHDLSDFIHPTYDRCLSVREAARLQSFPDHFVFRGSQSAQLRQVGNAVPPLVGRWVCRHVLQAALLLPRRTPDALTLVF